jgi:hypothetical protein
VVDVAEQVGQRAELPADVAARRGRQPQHDAVVGGGDAGVGVDVELPVAPAARRGHVGVDAEGGGDADGVEGAPRVQVDSVEDQTVPDGRQAEPVGADDRAVAVPFDQSGGGEFSDGSRSLGRIQSEYPGQVGHRGRLAGAQPVERRPAQPLTHRVSHARPSRRRDPIGHRHGHAAPGNSDAGVPARSSRSKPQAQQRPATAQQRSRRTTYPLPPAAAARNTPPPRQGRGQGSLTQTPDVVHQRPSSHGH